MDSKVKDQRGKHDYLGNNTTKDDLKRNRFTLNVSGHLPLINTFYRIDTVETHLSLDQIMNNWLVSSWLTLQRDEGLARSIR